MITSPIQTKFKLINEDLDKFFNIEIQFAERAKLSKLKRQSIFFNFIQKHRSYQSDVSEKFCDWVSEDEFYYF